MVAGLDGFVITAVDPEIAVIVVDDMLTFPGVPHVSATCELGAAMASGAGVGGWIKGGGLGRGWPLIRRPGNGPIMPLQFFNLFSVWGIG